MPSTRRVRLPLAAAAGLLCAGVLTLTPSGVSGIGGVATACAQDPTQSIPTLGPIDPSCGAVPDTDRDDVYDYEDNCNGAYNPSQKDTDKDSGEPPFEPVRTGYQDRDPDRKSTRLNSSHANISYAVFCLKKKKRN